MGRMHIVHIYKDYAPVVGGIENHVRDLGELLVGRGHRVTVLVTSLDGQSHIERPHPQLTVIKAARLLHAASTPLSLAMLGFARGLRPDVVHLHFPYPPGDLAALAVPGGAPLVITYHSDIVRQQNLLRIYRPLMGLTLRRARAIMATSPAYIASSPVLRRHAARCQVVPLGIDVGRFQTAAPAQGKGDHVLFVGRLRYYKGLHILLDAMRDLDARLTIAGSGPEQARLEAQAQALGIAHRVRFAGDVADADLPALYRSADVFVLPAHLRSEALGLALIEALASGVPSVSTELGTGTSFVNLHGETGLVVPPGDAAAMGQAIRTLLGDAALRQRYAAAAQARAQALFSRERMAAEVERVYHEALARG